VATADPADAAAEPAVVEAAPGAETPTEEEVAEVAPVAAPAEPPAAAEAGAGAPEPVIEQAPADAPPVEPSADSVDPTEAQSLRAAALSPLHPKLVRKIKRGLQELQNVTLDGLRRAKGEGSAESFLPDDADLDQLSALASEFLDQAYRSGGEAAGELAGHSLPAPDGDRDLGGDFRDDATARLHEQVGGTLRIGLSDSEDLPSLSDRVGAVFTELKGATAEELAATHLIRAYELGLLDAWRAGDVPARRWVMGREPRCPEARCRHNDQAGNLALGAAFPSGHDAPPVHVGCTCTTVPVTESIA
jgi:hypothetical protein